MAFELPKKLKLSHALGALGGGLAVVWGGWQLARAIELARWRNLKAESPEAAYNLPAGKTPDSSEAHLARGRFITTEVFPPDHAAGVSEFTRAVRLDPLSSLAWYELAKEEILVGDTVKARAALERSDQLDPNYPRQRFGAIQLWATLGEKDRAISLARKIASLGGEFRATAAEKLHTLPMDPAQVYGILDFGRLEGAELVDALWAVRDEDPLRMAELWKLVDPARLTGGDALKRAIRLAEDPLVYPTLVSLWKAQNPFLEFTKDDYPVDNPSLVRAPALESFPLGWQVPPTVPPDQIVRWVAPVEGDLFPKGFIQFTFNGDRPDEALRWTFYRFPVAALTEMQVEVDVRQIPAVTSNCTIRLMMGQEQIASASTTWAEEGWQALKLTLPARAAGGIAELQMTRTRRRADDNAAAPELHIGAVRFQVKNSIGEGIGQ